MPWKCSSTRGLHAALHRGGCRYCRSRRPVREAGEACVRSKAGQLAKFGSAPLFATCRARPVVRPPVVETADPEKRVLMNAGKAQPAVAGPMRRPANFENGSPLAAPLRPAMRGKGGALRPLCSRGARALLAHGSATRPAGARLPRNPRNSGLRRAAGRDLHREFAGLRTGPAPAGAAFPAFAKTRYSETTAATCGEPTPPRASLVATSRCVATRGPRPALLLARA